MNAAAIALAGGFGLDLLIGDPAWRWHPVRLIGALAGDLERRLNRGARRKLKGVVFLFLVVGVAGFCVAGLSTLSARFSPLAGALTAAAFIYFALATRCLADEAGKIARELKSGDIVQARRSLAMIVGRDTDRLDETEIVRATVETVAESAMDGIVSPLFFLALGGPTGMWMYKAVNTLDSIVGYKTERYRDFGWASARLDAWLNWIPSKLTALLIAAACASTGRYGKLSWEWTLRHLGKGPDADSDTAEAAMAGGLGVRLGGVNFYNGAPLVKPFLGEERERLSVGHIYRSVNASYAAAVGMCVLVIMVIVGMGRG